MPLFERPDDFEGALRNAVASALPGALVTRVRRTIISVKLRVDLDARLFIDAFFNARNQRTDLSLPCSVSPRLADVRRAVLGTPM